MLDATSQEMIKRAMKSARLERSAAFWDLCALVMGYVRSPRRNSSTTKVSRWV
ncbi:hypothetical protein [Epibacterium ulvae]|uniref:hypothetical protein n=1 Tax=Epibacterium ulvae TaxID=1156985 RepID=UPI0024938C59|nr:hypothetical protein [Epibacterium ulvae]